MGPFKGNRRDVAISGRSYSDFLSREWPRLTSDQAPEGAPIDVLPSADGSRFGVARARTAPGNSEERAGRRRAIQTRLQTRR